MFLMHLARALGMTVKQLLENTDSAELSDWHTLLTMKPEEEGVEDKLHSMFGGQR